MRTALKDGLSRFVTAFAEELGRGVARSVVAAVLIGLAAVIARLL